MTLHFWLLGEGIAGSLSPAMQNAALRAAGIDAVYELCECDADGLAAALVRLRHGEARGANVTAPHKQTAAVGCDALEGDARRLHAVNTLIVEGGRLVGANTDARGLAAALVEAGIAATGDAVVLGAGGVAPAVVLALLRGGAAPVTVAARRREQALAVAERFGPQAAVGAVTLGDPTLPVRLRAARVVVNATPVGLDALPLDPAALRTDAAVVDLRYRPQPVDVVTAARACGRVGMDGVGMLLHQGMLAFERWMGLPAPLEVARQALEAAAGTRR